MQTIGQNFFGLMGQTSNMSPMFGDVLMPPVTPVLIRGNIENYGDIYNEAPL